MHDIGELAMPGLVPGHAESATERFQPTLDARCDAAGDHQADTAARPFGKIHGQFVVIAGLVLQPGMHRPHQDAIGQDDMTQIERGEQLRAIHAIHTGSNDRMNVPVLSIGKQAPCTRGGRLRPETYANN